MLNLLEELLLLCIHEEKGTISFNASTKIDVCLAGALLMELELLHRVKANKKAVEITDRTPTGNLHLDSLLKLIDNSKRLRSPAHWITKAKGMFKHLRRECLEHLADNGFLQEEERQVFLFFNLTVYPLLDDRPKKEIRDQIRLVILRGETPSPRTAHLITLVHACGLTSTLFDKEERKDARKKIKAMVKEDPLAQAIIQTIQGANAAAYSG
ncbi:GOLPH3/VPS74 family protein [Desulfitobacterium sp. AusDCA]|uniref:GOLPH3/VPS74 family protein n=1 Tax=Desulfitobacterium sp. AusDCA TaxID=3240383 RepID=UPI003DA744C5